MTSRDDILASIRANLLRVDRPLPPIPLFDEHPPESLLSAFKEKSRTHGRGVSRTSTIGDILAPVRTKIANAKIGQHSNREGHRIDRVSFVKVSSA